MTSGNPLGFDSAMLHPPFVEVSVVVGMNIIILLLLKTYVRLIIARINMNKWLDLYSNADPWTASCRTMSMRVFNGPVGNSTISNLEQGRGLNLAVGRYRSTSG